jgi:hypothetical protein
MKSNLIDEGTRSCADLRSCSLPGELAPSDDEENDETNRLVVNRHCVLKGG